MITRVSSASRTVEIERGRRTVVIGERINPTGRKRLTAELESGNLDLAVEEARAQESEGADILDVNIGAPGVNQCRLLPEAVKLIQGVTVLPLCIDCQFPDALEAALAVYRGKALEAAVWDAVTALLWYPDLLVQELEKLTQPDSATREALEEELAQVRKRQEDLPKEERGWWKATARASTPTS